MPKVFTTKSNCKRAALKEYGSDAQAGVDFTIKEVEGGWSYKALPGGINYVAEAARKASKGAPVAEADKPALVTAEEVEGFALKSAGKDHFKLERVAAAAPVEGKATKQDTVVAMLRREGGASLAEIMEETGWLAHTTRGFISAAVGKKLGLLVASTKDPVRGRVYSIAA